MRNRTRWVRRVLAGIFSCTLLITLSTGVLNRVVAAPPTLGSLGQVVQSSTAEMLDENLRAAESALVAQGVSTENRVTYVAVLNKRNVVPNSPETRAHGAVGALLVGNRLMVRGSFRDLSSEMRDYATDPVNPPNPNITSAFHLHQGGPNGNGPFQYALDVVEDATGRTGRAMGEYTLTPDQLQALENGELYSDLHTTKNRGGELRGILIPY